MGKTYYTRKLSPIQKKAARMLVDNEWGLLSDDGERLTKEEIVNRLGIGRTTLYEWRKLPEFTRYLDHLTHNHLESYSAEVAAKLMQSVHKGNVEAIELYYKLRGKVDE